MTKIWISLSDARPKETFTFFGMRFDPYAATAAIKSGKLKAKRQDMDISAWATQILGLKLGDKTHKPVSFAMRINYDHADNVAPERLQEPIFVVATKQGHIVIDGNHRIANAFMNGNTHLPAYLISAAQAKKFNIRLR